MPAVEISPTLVAAALDGDQRALEQLLRALADDVLRLARRMLWHPQDAEDATQEILVKVATRLSTFRGDASVSTWVYRIAVNHLLTMAPRPCRGPTTASRRRARTAAASRSSRTSEGLSSGPLSRALGRGETLEHSRRVALTTGGR